MQIKDRSYNLETGAATQEIGVAALNQGQTRAWNFVSVLWHMTK